MLVVDDTEDAAEALRFALSLRGLIVEIAYDGRSALELAGRLLPDVVLCDINLPDMDGYAVARALRSGSRDLTLIALSGYRRPQDVERARSAGFDHYIAKPPDLAALFELIGRVRT